MKVSNAWIGLVASLLLAGCSEQATDQIGDGNEAYIETFLADGQRKAPDDLMAVEPPNLSQAHQDFAFADFLAHTSNDANTLSAPFDLQQLLSMVALGVDGTTLDAFSNASGFDLTDAATYAGLSVWEQRVDGHAAVERQRLLWGQQRYRFANDYLQAQAELFGPVMSGLDFQADAILAQTTINGALNGDLSLTEISDRTRLVTAQTTRLETAWSAAVNSEAVTGRFGLHDAQHWVDMVRIDGLLNVAEGENYRAVEVPFAEAGLSMVMITPAEDAFDAVRSGLNTAFWNALREKLAPAVTTVHVPQFTLARELLANDMPDLGMALINGSANFSKVNNAGFLYLEPTRQHIALAIDGQGLSATTATAAVHTAAESEPQDLFEGGDQGSYGSVEISVDLAGSRPCFYPPDQRPFLFAIYATETDTLLYLGQVLTLNGPTVEPDWTVPSFYFSSSSFSYATCGDSPLVDIYQYTGALQCQLESGVPASEMVQTLINAGIEVVNYYESNDGRARIQLCDTPDGTINVFSIHESQVPQAEALGFSRLTELQTALP